MFSKNFFHIYKIMFAWLFLLPGGNLYNAVDTPYMSILKIYTNKIDFKNYDIFIEVYLLLTRSFYRDDLGNAPMSHADVRQLCRISITIGVSTVEMLH